MRKFMYAYGFARLSHLSIRPIQFVFLVPLPWIRLEVTYHLAQRVAQQVFRLPTEHLPRPRDLDRVMRIGQVNHPGLDKSILFASDLLLHPRACLGDYFRDADRRPLLPVNQFADLIL